MTTSSTSESSTNYFPVKSYLSWDEYFMLQAMMASFKSKDPATKVGCVFVDEQNHQISMGFNGFIAGVDESKLPWGKEKNTPLEHQKYAYVVHSEANAILHATRSLQGARAYVTLFPCHECAKLMATSKIKEVIYLSDKHKDKESTAISKKIFDACNVTYRQLNLRAELLATLSDHYRSLLSEV